MESLEPEKILRNQQVAGSIPAGGSIFAITYKQFQSNLARNCHHLCHHCSRCHRSKEASILAAPASVAVGTTITDRPPHRSVRARLRIRLLRRMSGVEACIGIGVQNAGWRNPPVRAGVNVLSASVRADSGEPVDSAIVCTREV